MTKSYCDTLPNLVAKSLDTGRGRVYYESEGASPLLILQSGGPGGTHQCFHPFFGKAASFATVVYHDPIGVGKSTRRETGDYSLSGLIEEIEALRLQFEAERIYLLGHSFGGLVAQLYALEHPDKLEGLVLVTSSTGLPGVDEVRKRLDDRMSEDDIHVVRNILREKTHVAADVEYRAFLAGAWKRHFLREPDAEYKAHRAYEWDPDPTFVRRLGAEARTIDLSGCFESSRFRTLIIDSMNDLVWGPNKVEALANNHPHAQKVVFMNSGHYPFIEETTTFLRILSEFLQPHQTLTIA